MAPVRSYDVHAPSVNGTAWEADLREDRTDIGFRCRDHRAGLSDLGHVRDLSIQATHRHINENTFQTKSIANLRQNMYSGSPRRRPCP